jgi:hypothetical protein
MGHGSRAVDNSTDICANCGVNYCQWWHAPKEQSVRFASDCDSRRHLDLALKLESERDQLRAEVERLKATLHAPNAVACGEHIARAAREQSPGESDDMIVAKAVAGNMQTVDWYMTETRALKEKLATAERERDAAVGELAKVRGQAEQMRELLDRPLFCDYGVLPNHAVDQVQHVLDVIDGRVPVTPPPATEGRSVRAYESDFDKSWGVGKSLDTPEAREYFDNLRGRPATDEQAPYCVSCGWPELFPNRDKPCAVHATDEQAGERGACIAEIVAAAEEFDAVYTDGKPGADFEHRSTYARVRLHQAVSRARVGKGE